MKRRLHARTPSAPTGLRFFCVRFPRLTPWATALPPTSSASHCFTRHSSLLFERASALAQGLERARVGRLVGVRANGQAAFESALDSLLLARAEA